MTKTTDVSNDSDTENKAAAEIMSTFARTEKKISDILSSKTWSDKELVNIKNVVEQEIQKILKSLPYKTHKVILVKRKTAKSEVEAVSDFAKSEIIALSEMGHTNRDIANMFRFNGATIRSVLKLSKSSKK